MNKLEEMLQDNSGGLSSMRIVLLVWMAGMLTTSIYLSFKAGKWVDLPSGLITITEFVLGSKVVQRYVEKPNTVPPTT